MRSASVCGRCTASRYTGLSPMVSATASAFPSGFAHIWPSPGRGAIVALARMAVPDLVVFFDVFLRFDSRLASPVPHTRSRQACKLTYLQTPEFHASLFFFLRHL